MNSILPEISLAVSGDELWAIAPSLPVLDLADVRRLLPAEFRGYDYAGFMPVRDESGRLLDGWILRAPKRR